MKKLTLKDLNDYGIKNELTEQLNAYALHYGIEPKRIEIPKLKPQTHNFKHI